jgi:hypothetical protein
MANDGPNAVAEANWTAYQRARDAGHDAWLIVAKKCDRFYLGDQWDDADKQKLDNEGRPALTINEVLKVVNAYLGKQSKQRVDPVFKPKRDATRETAEALSKLVEQILDSNGYEFTEKDVFEDGLVTDRGYFDVRMDFEENMYGEIRVRDHDPYEILPDPDAKSYDPNDWNEVIVTRWLTMDDVEANYGKDKRKELEAHTLGGNTFGEDSVRFEGARTFGNEEFGFESSRRLPEDIAEIPVRAIRVIERQYKRLANIRYFVDEVTGDMSQIPSEISDERAAEIANAMGLAIIEKSGKRIRWTTTVDNVVLHDSWSPYRSFTIVPYFPFFRRGLTSGVVRQLLDPQEQFNKMESQMLHIVNTTANSGWMADEGSLANMTTEELEERGAETGLVLIVKRGSERPEKIQPNQIPTGLDRLASRAQTNVAGIAGVEGLVEAPQREVSGVALDRIEANGLIQVDVPFDSLKRTRKLLMRKVLELIQDFYTETRVIRVTIGDGFAGADEEMIINGINSAGEIVNDVTLGEYDVIPSSKPARDNYEDDQFANAIMMRDAGVLVPDDVVIRHSQLEDKHAVADRVAELQGTAPPTPEEIEIAAMQQKIEMRAMSLEADKLEAEVQELRARAAQSFAKAEVLQGEAQQAAIQAGTEMRLKMIDLQAKLQMFYDNLENKLQLAGIHARNKRQTTIVQEGTKHSIAELNLLAKPTPTNASTK